MRCLIVLNVMQASTQASMAHRLMQRASTVLRASTLSSMAHRLAQRAPTVRQGSISRQEPLTSAPNKIVNARENKSKAVMEHLQSRE